MKLRTAAVAMFALTTLAGYALVHADEHRGGGGGGERHAAPAPHAAQQRMAPPAYQAHPPGLHPHGAMVRPHAIRVMGARVAAYGGHQWRHWEHAEFARPVYYWEWSAIRSVTCIAEDSYGDQYPVTESVTPGFGINNMTSVEDDALDRCNVESGGDQTCYLATCTHY